MREFAGKKVLIVDDQQIMHKMMERILSRKGMQVFTAGNGNAAIAVALERQVDVIILDIMMPMMDGFQTLEMLRAMRATRRIPVIVASSQANAATFTRVISMGADDFLAKPFDAADLVKKIRQQLGNPTGASRSLFALLQSEKSAVQAPDLQELRESFQETRRHLIVELIRLISQRKQEELIDFCGAFREICRRLRLPEVETPVARLQQAAVQEQWDNMPLFLEHLYRQVQGFGEE